MSQFTDLFIRRPVLAAVLSLLLLLVGGMSFYKLQIRQYPALSQTSIVVTTVYPGANAAVVKGFITTPLEEAVAKTEGIDTIVSNSQRNVSTITLNLRVNANSDRAMTEVLSLVNQVKSTLPREALDPQVIKKTGQGVALMYMAFPSQTMSTEQTTDVLRRVVAPRLQAIPGVAEAQILGGRNVAMRIWLNPERMAALGVTAGDVRAALLANNFTSAPGEVKGSWVATSINAHTSPDNVQAFSQLVVATHGDSLIKVGDIATVELGPESVDSSSSFDGVHAVFIGIYGTESANPLDVIDEVRRVFPEMQAELPPGINAAIAYDATDFIRSSVREVTLTLAEASAVVILVIFLFLGNLRSTIVPVVTIPLSLVGVLSMLLLMGYSINLLTLLALVLAIGLVVDDAIVVVENIYRHIEQGKTPLEASLSGAREIVGPVIAMTITLAAVYAPIGFVSGVTGALFREFAFTLAGAVVVSGFVALTLSPMMCSKLLKAHSGGAQAGRFSALVDRLFASLRDRYERRLQKTLNFRAMSMLVLAGTLTLTGIMYLSTPRELAPSEDQSFILSVVKTPQYANLNYLEHMTDKLHEQLEAVPERAHDFIINGAGGTRQAFVGMILKPWDQRTRSAKQVMQDVKSRLTVIPGALAIAFTPAALPGSSGGPPVQFVIRTSGDFQGLSGALADMQNAAQSSGLFLFVDGDLKFDTPQVEVKIDAAKANRLGISMQDIGTTLNTLLGGNFVNRFNLQGRSYEVIPQVPRDQRLTAEALLQYQVRTGTGELVPLSTVVTVSQSVQPNALTGFQQLNAATLSAVPMPGHTVGEAVDFLSAKAREVLPPGYSYDFQGDARQYVQEGNTLTLTFVFALIVIFLVLAGQFESFRDPLTILIALPTSIFGALLPLNALGAMGLASINLYTQIGLVTLIGLISKHGILMVDFANRLQADERLSRREAIVRAAAVRLRPILMTTFAMIVGMIPLIMAHGAGAQSRFYIGLVIAAGMAVGTVFTLFITPAVYTFVARDHARQEDGGG